MAEILGFKGLAAFVLFICVLFLLPSAAVAAGLDPDSAQCVKCHETTVDPANPARVCHSAGCDHPIGLDYVAASAGNPGLTPVGELARGIKLVGVGASRIGCTTCHVPYLKVNHKALAARRAAGAGDPMLSTSNSGSFLCLGCHRK